MAFISFKGRNAFIIGHFITAYENEGFVEWTEQKILFKGGLKGKQSGKI